MRLKKLLLPLALIAPVLAAAKGLTIVTPREGSPVVQRAASELAGYLERMGNPKPSVAQTGEGDIYLGAGLGVGRFGGDDLLKPIQGGGADPDSFIIRSIGRKLVIDGNSPRAILFGTYQYLETLGVHWYFPGRENEVVPTREPVLTGYHVVSVPSFRKRGVVTFSHRVIFTIHPENYEQPGFRDFVAFAAHNKLNTIAIHQDYDLGEAAKIINEYGLDAEQEIHYFGNKFCPDDERALQENTKRFDAYLAKAPASMKHFFLWPDDEYLPKCASEKYKDYQVADLTLNFSNEMARIAERQRPGASFAFISYLNTWAPPAHVKPDANVSLEWAPMNQSFGQSLDDPASPTNTGLRRDLEQYLKIFPAGTAQVLGYWLDDTLWSRTGLGNFPLRPQTLQNDLRYYHSLGFRGITTFGVFAMKDGFVSKAPPAVFLYPALLWNVDGDVEKALADFCRNYYGDEAAAGVLKEIERMDSIVYVDGHKLHVDEFRLPEFNASLQSAVKQATELLNRQTDPLRRSRLAKLLVESASRANHAIQ